MVCLSRFDGFLYGPPSSSSSFGVAFTDEGGRLELLRRRCQRKDTHPHAYSFISMYACIEPLELFLSLQAFLAPSASGGKSWVLAECNGTRKRRNKEEKKASLVPELHTDASVCIQT